MANVISCGGHGVRAQLQTLGTDSRSQNPGDAVRPLCQVTLTIWRKLVSVEHGETEHVLVQILDEELAIEIPLGVQCVLEGPGGIALGAHADLTVRVTLPCRDKPGTHAVW